jgi:hypothetical protein
MATATKANYSMIEALASIADGLIDEIKDLHDQASFSVRFAQACMARPALMERKLSDLIYALLRARGVAGCPRCGGHGYITRVDGSEWWQDDCPACGGYERYEVDDNIPF